MITTKEQALKLTVPKLKEELTARGLSHDGLKVGFSLALEIWPLDGRSIPLPHLFLPRTLDGVVARRVTKIALLESPKLQLVS